MKRVKDWQRLFRLEESGEQLDRNINEELHFHIEGRVEELVREGMTEDEARAEALRVFGNVDGIRHDLQKYGRSGIRRKRLRDSAFDFLRDLKFAGRKLTRNPGFSIAALLSITLGIGVNTTIFSMFNALLIRPLPVNEPGALVSVHTANEGGSRYGSTSYPDYADLVELNGVFDGLAAHSYSPVSLTGGGDSGVVMGQMVSWDFFPILGIDALPGRTFLPEEDLTPGTHPVVILSHQIWMRRFAADPGTVGSTVHLNGHPFTVIGIAQEGFRGISPVIVTDLWVPLMMVGQVFPYSVNLEGRIDPWLNLVGRLKPGVSLEQARAAMDIVSEDLQQEYPGLNHGKSFTVMEADRTRLTHTVTTDNAATLMTILMVVVGLVLMIACINVANLHIASATRRQREIALRYSLGASRGRIVRQLLIESTLLSIVAGAAGLLVAVWSVDLLATLAQSPEIPLEMDFSPDWLVFLFTFLLAGLTGLFFGLAPAVQTVRPGQFSTLRDLTTLQAQTPSRSRLQNALISGQIAISLILLISTGLFVQGMRNTLAVDPGFDISEGVVVPVNLGYGIYSDSEGELFFSELEDRVRRIPGIQSVSVAVALPLGQMHGHHDVEIDGYEPGPGEFMLFKRNMIGPTYLETMGIPIVSGRGIDERDTEDSQPVVIINEEMARRFWPDGDPVGRILYADLGVARTVVGVMKDGRYSRLDEPVEPYLCIPLSQSEYVQRRYLVARTTGNQDEIIGEVQREIHDMDPELPITVTTLEEFLGISVGSAKLPVLLLGIFSLLALVLAMVGVYGVTYYLVSRRAQEFGIRMALGARTEDIVKGIAWRGLKTALIGVGLGIAASVAVTSLLSGFLFEVNPLDPVVYATAAVLLTAIALLASYIPARWASTLDPVDSLRVE